MQRQLEGMPALVLNTPDVRGAAMGARMAESGAQLLGICVSLTRGVHKLDL
jgi:hypothetical protein